LPNTVIVRVEGIQELWDALNIIDRAMRGRMIRNAVKMACKPLRDVMATMAPMDTRSLRDSIAFKVWFKDGIAVGLVGPSKRGKGMRLRNGEMISPTRYAHFLEFGTSKMAARPFMRPAFDVTRGYMEHAMVDSLWQDLWALARNAEQYKVLAQHYA